MNHSHDYDQNTFWMVNQSKPQHTLSFDLLHAGDLGLWGNHLFEKLKSHITTLGQDASKKVDA